MQYASRLSAHQKRRTAGWTKLAVANETSKSGELVFYGLGQTGALKPGRTATKSVRKQGLEQDPWLCMGVVHQWTGRSVSFVAVRYKVNVLLPHLL